MTYESGPKAALGTAAKPSDDSVTRSADDSLPLTVGEVDARAVCEAIVDEGLRTFIEVGTALTTIRDQRLYRGTHADFAGYLHGRFGISQSQGYRMIDAARVALSPIGDKISNEAQARELVPLLDDPARLREVVTRAQAAGKITAASLRRERDRQVGPTWNGRIHEVNKFLPWMDQYQYASFVRSIRANGLLVPIVLGVDGTLLDGKIRLKACEDAGEEPRFVTFPSTDENVWRSSPTVEERAAIGVTAVDHYEREGRELPPGSKAQQISLLMGVSPTAARDALKIANAT